MKLLAIEPRQMIIRYAFITVLLLAFFILSGLASGNIMFVNHYDSYRSFHDTYYVYNVGEWAKKFLSFSFYPVAFVFSIFQILSIFRFLTIKNTATNKSIAIKIIFLLFFISWGTLLLYNFTLG